MGKRINSNQKGKRGEREAAEFLREHGLDARRGVQYKGGPDSPDLITVLDDIYHLECKRTERADVLRWLEQVSKETTPAHAPVVLWRRNYKKWVAMMWAEDWLSGVEAQRNCRE